MSTSRLHPDLLISAKRAFEAAGIGTSDCRVVRPEGEDYLELRSASGVKRIAVAAMTLDGKIVGAWRTDS